MANPFAAKWKSGESRESIDEIIYAIRDKEEEVEFFKGSQTMNKCLQ